MTEATKIQIANEQESEISKCCICLEDNGVLHWNQLLYDYSDLTYKDCYYKYTHLEYSDEDSFSPMLCRNCSDGLAYIDAFITKAIKTHVMLKESFCIDIRRADEVYIKDESMNFETILMEESEIKPEIEIQPVHEESCEDFFTIPLENNIPSEHESCTPPVTQAKKSKKLKTKKSKISTDQMADQYLEEKKDFATGVKSDKKQTKLKMEQPVCCSICSKVLSSKYRAITHEKTHIKNRERNETCGICGLKFLSKTILKSHMLTHSETREKAHKCEFCDKAFHYKGGLNLHRRIHLGQMVSCSLCTKEFYRQSDLDTHMLSHSATRITSDVKLRKKYFVRCEFCSESVRSTNYKSHAAKHMNEPLFKCSICNKEFFVRSSCAKHLRKTHKKSSMDGANYIIAYKKNRMSQLFFKQKVKACINDE